MSDSTSSRAMAKRIRGTTVAASGAVLESLLATAIDAERKRASDAMEAIAKQWAGTDLDAVEAEVLDGCDGLDGRDYYASAMHRAARIARGSTC